MGPSTGWTSNAWPRRPRGRVVALKKRTRCPSFSSRPADSTISEMRLFYCRLPRRTEEFIREHGFDAKDNHVSNHRWNDKEISLISFRARTAANAAPTRSFRT
mmetsp:Transcript_16545/g.53886  ORF Transcript_16545/g.53886 Transcript_16545/m.53886 type:complete len:103 (+) Transcript_16545:1194-1502(+)